MNPIGNLYFEHLDYTYTSYIATPTPKSCKLLITFSWVMGAHVIIVSAPVQFKDWDLVWGLTIRRIF